MVAGSRPDSATVQQARETASERLREASLTGVAVVVPVLVALYVLSMATGVRHAGPSQARLERAAGEDRADERPAEDSE